MLNVFFPFLLLKAHKWTRPVSCWLATLNLSNRLLINLFVKFLISHFFPIKGSHKHILWIRLYLYLYVNANELLSNSAGPEATDPIRRSDMRNSDAIFTRTLEVVQPASLHWSGSSESPSAGGFTPPKKAVESFMRAFSCILFVALRYPVDWTENMSGRKNDPQHTKPFKCSCSETLLKGK